MGIEQISHPYTSWDKGRLINWDRIVAGNSTARRRALAAEEVARVGDDLTLTDTLMWEDKGGVHVREILADEESGTMRDPRVIQFAQTSRRLFRIRWIRNADGTPVKPGDVVSWKVAPLTREPGTGAPLTTKKLRSMRRRGEPTEFRHSAKVAEDGCILVPFSDASLLLQRFGFEAPKYREKSGDSYNWLLVEEPLWVVPQTAQDQASKKK